MHRALVALALYAFSALLPSSIASADEEIQGCAPENIVGEVISVQGEVDVLDTRGATLRRLLPGTDMLGDSGRQLCRGETLQTGALSRATLAVTNPPSVIRLDANTLLATVRASDENTQPPNGSLLGADDSRSALNWCRRAVDSVWLDLRRGVLRLFTTEPTRLDISTPYLNASVEGTEFSLHVNEDTSQVSVIEGKVRACNALGITSVLPGQTASARAGQKPAIVDTGNTVRWALHYPALDTGTDGSTRTRAALEFIIAGRIEEALTLLGEDTDAVDLALRSIIAITANEQGKALQLAQQAVQLNDKSPTAWTALSYVQQAGYALEQALKSAALAVQLAPQDALALARLAELEFIAGDALEAESVAKRAVRLGHSLSRTHTVLGFIGLDGTNLAVAEASFRRALERDEADPFPRLGLGLIEVRRGHTIKALAHLEAAVSLDPENALLRIYLGRVYALDGRPTQALDQFRLAEDIDDSDPLPHLYRAFVRHATNDTHRALIDLQSALDKNDNRGVFRTRSLLDADLATTLAARGRIYEEVGFRSLTLSEGTDALHRNPRDHAAHRLMADAYQSRPRHEIARASEQLQAQIRQPLNTNPAQSSLGLSRLDNFPDTGPRAISLNEYSRLFSRQGFTTNLSHTNGANNTQATELQSNWLLSSTLASAGFYRFQSDGLDYNRDGRLELASLFVQQRLGRRLSAQIELSDTDSEGGADRDPRFDRDPEEYNRTDRFEENWKRARLGLRWRYTANTDLYFNHDHSSLRRRLVEVLAGTKRVNVDSHHSELQMASKIGQAERVIGLGYSTQRAEESCVDTGFRETLVDHAVAYGYLYPSRKYLDSSRVDYTLGVGFDDLDLRGVQNRYFSPKLGVNAEHGRFRWRGVLARTINRTLATNRTLEPTQVAGFSQLYDDFAGTVSTLGGVGAGIRLGAKKPSQSGNVYLDAELVHRHLDKPTTTGGECPPGKPDKTTEFEERRYSVGLYTSTRPLSIALRFEHEEYISPDGARSQHFFVDSTTERVSIELGAELKRHIKVIVTPQHIRQFGTFFNIFRLPTEAKEQVYYGRDSFWTLDVALQLEFDKLVGTRFAGSLSVELENVFDRNFNFQESDPDVPSVSYERALTMRLQVNFD